MGLLTDGCKYFWKLTQQIKSTLTRGQCDGAKCWQSMSALTNDVPLRGEVGYLITSSGSCYCTTDDEVAHKEGVGVGVGLGGK